MWRLKQEWKIMGIDPVLILLSVTAVFALLSAFGGELLRLACVGSEVIFPILTSITVCEGGRFRADDDFETIAAGSRSLFRWVWGRFAAAFAEGTAAAFLAMLAVWAMRREMPFLEMVSLYFAPALFLSTVSVLLGLCLSQEHAATLLGGLLWAFALMARRLAGTPGIRLFYLFPRFAQGADSVWRANKAVLCVLSLVLWGVVYGICKGAKVTIFD